MNKLYCLLILLLISSNTLSQDFWKNTGLNNFFIGYMAQDNSGRIYASEWQGSGDSVFYSDNSGQSWQSYGEVNDSQYINISSILVLNNNDVLISAWGQNGGVYKSTDGSQSWMKKNSGFLINDLSYIYSRNDTLYAAAYDGVYLSIDAAENWTKLNSNPDTIIDVRSIAIAPDNNIFVIDQSTVLKSVDNGSTWDTLNPIGYTYINPTNMIITLDKFLFAGTDTKGIFKSSDWGFSWTQNLIPYNVRNITYNTAGNIIIGTELDGVLLSVDNGESWQYINTGLPNPPHFINCVFIDKDDYAYCSVHNYGIFKSVSPVVSVQEDDNEPQIIIYELSQNYPNPFNPSTRISFTLPQSGFTTLKVYDVLGNEIIIILEKDLAVGSYDINFDGSGLTSGVYYYTLKSGNFIESKKMILLR